MKWTVYELGLWLHCVNQARRALRALRGLVRLKSLIQGNAVKHQASTTLRCMQTLARVQSQIRSRRIRMSEENQALQQQLLQKRESELENLSASVSLPVFLFCQPRPFLSFDYTFTLLLVCWSLLWVPVLMNLATGWSFISIEEEIALC